jgi:hypothetical protein
MLGSLLITLAILHMVADKTVASFLTVGACTVWSLARGYCIRRYFNRSIVASRHEEALERIYVRASECDFHSRDMPLPEVLIIQDIAGRALEDD